MSDRPEADVWEPLRFFLGTWSGTCSGKPGEGRVERSYAFVLNEQFLQVTGRSTFEPQERNPDGEIHEELGLWSYDRARGVHVCREFLAEGFVNRYVLESHDAARLVLVTEAIESLPPGWEARTTVEILSEDHFTETFELRKPDGNWDCYITTELRRASAED
jgi:hypothetical protein